MLHHPDEPSPEGTYWFTDEAYTKHGHWLDPSKANRIDAMWFMRVKEQSPTIQTLQRTPLTPILLLSTIQPAMASAITPTIRLPTYRAIPDGWTKRRMLNVCNVTLGLMFVEHVPVHRQYAIDTAKEIWWPLARSPWIGEVLDNHLRKLHAHDGRAVKRRAVRAASAAASANATVGSFIVYEKLFDYAIINIL
ncbi:hypothetical protein FPQ18DRAFT_310253 [Pyronema domesticum]|nr:hypothetical protein FPQ18DRAFT_310253 [Pyronema domesticum]